jgi:large-conductance mechanosensitive channel
VINFLIIAWVVFLPVKSMNRLRARRRPRPQPPPPPTEVEVRSKSWSN